MSKQIISPQSTISLPYLKPKLKKSSSQPKAARDNEQTVRMFEEKLLYHRQEIDKNAIIIRMLNGQFEQLKQELKKERELSEGHQLEKRVLEESMGKVKTELGYIRESYQMLKEQYKGECERHMMLLEKVSQEGGSNQKVVDLEKTIESLSKQIAVQAEANNILKQKVREEEEQKQKVADLVETYLNEMRNIRKMNIDLVTQIEIQQAQIALKEKQIRQIRQKTHRQAIDSKLLKLLHEKEHLNNQISKYKELHASWDLEKRQITTDYETKLKDKKKQYKDLIVMNQTQIKNLTHKHQQQINSLKLKVDQLNSMLGYADKLKDNERRIKAILACTFCKNTLREPVTAIPCGHSFCTNCRKGYQKECFSCGSKVKIEAVYRNQLLDEIVRLLKIVEEATGFLTSINTKGQ